MRQEGIKTANYQIMEPGDDIERATPFVFKKSGLAGGKGVTIVKTVDDIPDITETCVVEEFIPPGQEVSHMYFCDGQTAVAMPPSQDHKRRFEGDVGPMTGGMGAIAPCPHGRSIVDSYAQKVVNRMRYKKTPYVGVLYIGVMVPTLGDPFVLEFNCRFGDPEAQAVIPLLDSNLFDIMMACVNGTLHKTDVRWKADTHSAAVVICASGYPSFDRTESKIGTSEAMIKTDRMSGRIATVCQTGKTLRRALANCYKIIDEVVPTDDFACRRDIGHHSIPLRIGVLGSTRGTDLKGILKAIESRSLYASIEVVISNIPTAGILTLGAKAQYLSPKGLQRDQYDRIVTSVLREHQVDVVILIGYMRVLGASFCYEWSGRCFNVHPSLLPKYAGSMDKSVHARVLSDGATETGCSIHRVASSVDQGELIVQKKCYVYGKDTVYTLKSRVQALEVQAFLDLFRIHKTNFT